MLDQLEGYVTWLIDMGWGWWPFPFLRLGRDERMSTVHVLKISLLYGILFGLIRYVVTGIPALFLYVTIILFVAYRLTFAPLWNRRARRLQNRTGDLSHASVLVTCTSHALIGVCTTLHCPVAPIP